MTDPIRFKKYANRRLYNLSTSEYVTLGEMLGLLRKGNTVEIIDATTKQDVTAYILTQIILDQAKNKNTLLPVPLLHMIIQYGDNVLIDFFNNHLQQVIRSYLEYRHAMDAQFRHWLDLGKNLTDIAQQGMKSANPFHTYFGGLEKNSPHEDEEKS